jgi:hypothetical protein
VPSEGLANFLGSFNKTGTESNNGRDWVNGRVISLASERASGSSPKHPLIEKTLNFGERID